MSVSDERLRNTRAWAEARIGTLSGADVIVAAIDELLSLRSIGECICPKCGLRHGAQNQSGEF